MRTVLSAIAIYSLNRCMARSSRIRVAGSCNFSAEECGGELSCALTSEALDLLMDE